MNIHLNLVGYPYNYIPAYKSDEMRNGIQYETCIIFRFVIMIVMPGCICLL